jgi:hypothetical protein
MYVNQGKSVRKLTPQKQVWLGGYISLCPDPYPGIISEMFLIGSAAATYKEFNYFFLQFLLYAGHKYHLKFSSSKFRKSG